MGKETSHFSQILLSTALLLMPNVFRTATSAVLVAFLVATPPNVVSQSTSSSSSTSSELNHSISDNDCGKPKRDAVLILFADKAYLPCLLHLMESIRTKAAGKDSIIIISNDLLTSDLGKNAFVDVKIRRPSEALSALGPRYQKLEFLRIRGYRRGIYLDADGTVKKSIDPLLAVPFTGGTQFLFRDNGIGIGKGGLFSYFRNPRSIQAMWPGVKDYPHVGSSAFFVVNFDALPDDAFDKAVAIAYSCKTFVKLHDQSVLHILSGGKWQVFADCNPSGQLELRFPSANLTRYWSRRLCAGEQPIYSHDYKKSCLGGKDKMPDINRPVTWNRLHLKSEEDAR